MTSPDFLMDLLNEGDKPSQQPQQPARTAGSPAPVTDTATRVEALIAALRAAGVDITADYNDWLKVGFALAGEFGEGGRGHFHDISSLYPGYDQAESDTKYTECLKSDSERTDISTIFYLAKNQGVPSNDPRTRRERCKWHHVQKVKVTKMSLCPFPKMTPRKCRFFRSSPLSGTPEQVKSLIRDSENGLLSRFMFFCINATPEWLDGFDSYGSDEPLEETFDALGARFTAFTKLLEEKPKVIFRLSLPQTGKFNEFFTAEKDRMQELNGDRYSASTHRLAWCFLRIAMVLTTLRLMDSGTIKESVECSDADFDMTMEIIRVISEHNDYIFNVLDRERPEGIAVADSYSSATRKTILAALPGYFKTDDMKTVAKNVGKSLRTVRRQERSSLREGTTPPLRRSLRTFRVLRFTDINSPGPLLQSCLRHRRCAPLHPLLASMRHLWYARPESAAPKTVSALRRASLAFNDGGMRSSCRLTQHPLLGRSRP